MHELVVATHMHIKMHLTCGSIGMQGRRTPNHPYPGPAQPVHTNHFKIIHYYLFFAKDSYSI
jgi:hypothetical protein